MKSRSLKIRNDEFIEKEYRKFSEEYIWNYLYSISGLPRILRGIDKYFLKNKLIKALYYKKSKKLAILNFIECEAHRELFINGLKNSLNINQ